MNTHSNKCHLTKLYTLILSLALVLSACSKDNNTEITETIVEIPQFLQSVAALTKEDGTLKAYITIDKGAGGIRTEMTRNGDNKGFSALVPDLSREIHNILIEFEFGNSEESPITLAILDKDVDLREGNREVTFVDGDYISDVNHRDYNINLHDVFDFDADDDGHSNLIEIIAGSNATLSTDEPQLEICKIGTSKLNLCELGA